jgi:arylsulfatase A
MAGVRQRDYISFVPALLGEPERQQRHPYLYWEFYERQGGAQTVRMDQWKAVASRPSLARSSFTIWERI